MATQVSNTIRRLRFDANEMTQADLAARVGVTRQTIIAIEAGKYSLSLELAFRIERRAFLMELPGQLSARFELVVLGTCTRRAHPTYCCDGANRRPSNHLFHDRLHKVLG